MRLAQAKGANETTNAAVIATYDLSCAMDKTDGCPFGSVHNVHKVPVGQRIAAQLMKMKMVRDGVIIATGSACMHACMMICKAASISSTLEGMCLWGRQP